MELFALLFAAIAVVVAAAALVIARQKAPPAWSRRITAAEAAVADNAESLQALQRSVAKWRSRQAARERRGAPDAAGDAGADGQLLGPDPDKDPVAWRDWVNNRGGLAVLTGRKK